MQIRAATSLLALLYWHQSNNKSDLVRGASYHKQIQRKQQTPPIKPTVWDYVYVGCITFDFSTYYFKPLFVDSNLPRAVNIANAENNSTILGFLHGFHLWGSTNGYSVHEIIFLYPSECSRSSTQFATW